MASPTEMELARPEEERPVKEEPCTAADPEPPRVEESQAMVSEAPPPAPAAAAAEPGGYVHLLLADADGSHEPQVFRMKSGQAMLRLLRTYVDFRRFRAADAGSLRLSALGQDQLDHSATASAIGLADGDRVTVHVPPEVLAAAKSQRRPRQPPVPTQRSQRRVRQAPAPTQRARGQARPARDAEEGGGQEQQPKKPPSSYFLWFSENREAIAEAVGSGDARSLPRLAGEHWKALSAEERAPYETRVAALKAEYDQAMSDFVSRGGVPQRRTRGSARSGAELGQTLPKRPWGGAYGEFLRQHRDEIKRSLPADAQVYDVTREGGRRWKELPEDAKGQYQELFNRKLDAYKALVQEHPAAPNVARSAVITQGPAKGWRVQAWLNVRKAVQWRIVEPRRSGHAFRTFSNFKALRGNVDGKVYKQLTQMVKPGLVRRLGDRAATRRRVAPAARPALEDETPSKRRRPVGGEAAARACARPLRARGDEETPERLERPLAATQVFTPIMMACPGKAA